MSVSTLTQLLAQLLRRFLKLLASIPGLPPFRLLSSLFVYVSRQTRKNALRPTIQLQGPSTSSGTLDGGFVCAMNVPLSGPSDAHEHPRPSPVDLPYTNARSPSGHLIPPVPARRHSRDCIESMTSSQTPLYDEPRGIDHGASQVACDPDLPSSFSATPHAHHYGHAPSSDILTQLSQPLSPIHHTIGVVSEASPGTSEVKSPSRAACLHSDASKWEPFRSRTPSSMKSSRLSVSQNSHSSQHSVGRASYREHHGPTFRVHTPVPEQDISIFRHSPIPRTAEPGGSTVFPTIVAPPDADNRPGEPVQFLSAHRFCPMSVNGVLRYECRKTRCPSGHDYNIGAMLYEYPRTSEKIPDGWTAYQHPEGALYFVHDESKTFTEVNICDEEIHDDIEYFRTFLLSELEAEIKIQDCPESLKVDEVQLVLEPKLDDQGLLCCYYFVNPRTRSLFWLDEWEGYDIFKDCRGVLSLPHKGLGIQAHYWCATYVSRGLSHWDLYPNFCEITQELKDEVVDMILHATCDHLTSNRSSCPLNPKELKKYLSLIERVDPEKTEHRKHSAVVIGRIMHIFYRNYFLNFYGEDCARLNFDQAVHGWRYHPSLLMTTFAPLLFMAPVNNVRLLHRIFVDDIASKEKWNMFVTKLNSQLQETSVLATVLLNANVAFLPKESDTAQQFLSYMSLVASMASIILGLVFMGHSRTEARNTPFKAAKFLHGLWHKKHGLETLAIIYSLPHAFLMWGMCLFFAAFATQWCYPGDTPLRASAGAFMLTVAVLVAWCIWTARERCDFWWFQPDPNEPELSEDEGEDKTSLGLDLLWRVKGSLTQRLRMFRLLSYESHATQDVASLHEVHDQASKHA